MGTNIGKNEHGREIMYQVWYKEETTGLTKNIGIVGKRFNKARIVKACREKGIKPPVQVTWVTLQKWGHRENSRVITWKE